MVWSNISFTSLLHLWGWGKVHHTKKEYGLQLDIKINKSISLLQINSILKKTEMLWPIAQVNSAPCASSEDISNKLHLLSEAGCSGTCL